MVTLEGVSKGFKNNEGWFRKETLTVLKNISFSIKRGEAVALVGESGSGKTTVAKILACIHAHDSGLVRVCGQEVSPKNRPSMDYRSKVQMIFQDPFGSLNPVKTLGYHIERPLLRHGKAQDRADAEAKSAQLLERVGLVPGRDFAKKFPHEASGGQLQRVCIARVLAVEPSLILADEPTSMLDVSVRAGILNLLLDLKKEGGISFLYITHDLASANYFADRIIVMYKGEIVEEGATGSLLSNPQHEYTKRLLAAAT